MGLIEINRHPTDKELRDFGVISLIATFIISLLLYLLKGLEIRWALLVFVVGFIIFLCSLTSAKLTRIIYLALTMLTAPIGLAVSFTLMAVFYFLLLTPIGLLFRLIGRDLLGRKFDPDAKSYWRPHKSHNDPERYFHQF